MKINGETPGLNTVNVNIRRGSKVYTFTAKTVQGIDDFDKLCPAPVPPTVTKPGGVVIKNIEAPGYKEALVEHSAKRSAYIIIKSLNATEGLEWEKVKLEDSNTWLLWSDELRESGFSEAEIIRLVNAVGEAQGITDETLEAARESFLSEAAAPAKG